MKTFPLEKYGTTRPIQLQVASYMNGNLAIEMITWEDGCPEPWNTLTVRKRLRLHRHQQQRKRNPHMA